MTRPSTSADHLPRPDSDSGAAASAGRTATSHEVNPNVAPRDERIPAEPTSRILGFRSVSAMNHVRRRLQRVQDRVTGLDRPYPDFAKEVGLVRDLAARKHQASQLDREALGRGAAYLEHQAQLARVVREREVAFDEVNILVVPEWGGIRWPRSAWTYSRMKVAAIRDGTDPPVP